MKTTLEFGNTRLEADAENATPTAGGYILHGASVTLGLPADPINFYRHGWQSWSLTAWHAPNQPIPVQKPERLHPLQIDPLYAKHPAPNGSWVAALEFTGGNILLLGALNIDAHVALHNRDLHGWYEPGVPDEWFVGYGKETDVFARYAALLAEQLGQAPGKPSPNVWCSWYSLYTAIDQAMLVETFEQLGSLPFDVLQIDDGWQVSIGDWVPNSKFPDGMQVLADKIKTTGRQAGLWLAPLIAVQSSRLFQDHPDWFLKNQAGQFASAGFNWGEPLYALDTTHPEALNWLTELMQQVRAWGFDYLKLDFLYAGALPGQRHQDIPREAAYRQGLQSIRAAMGADAYFLTCGAPIIPSIGLCDAIRIGPDVAGEWENYRDAILLQNFTTPGTKNAIRTTVNRLWLKPLVATDPDVVYFRSEHISLAAEQKLLLKNLADVCEFKATSDLPQWLKTEEQTELQEFLMARPTVQRTGRTTFLLDSRSVDFDPAMQLPRRANGFDTILGAFVGWAGSNSLALSMLDKIGKKSLEKVKKSI